MRSAKGRGVRYTAGGDSGPLRSWSPSFWVPGPMPVPSGKVAAQQRAIPRLTRRREAS